jgi:hypothetical protein
VLWREAPRPSSNVLVELAAWVLRDRRNTAAVDRRVRSVADSMRRAPGAMSAGWGADARGFRLVAFDDRARRVALVGGGPAGHTVLGQFATGGPDSTLVVLVDDVRGDARAPYRGRVVARVRGPAADATGLTLSDAERARLARGEPPRPADTPGALRRVLAAIPAAHAFLR